MKSPEPDDLLEAIISNEEIEVLRVTSLERMLAVSRRSRQRRRIAGRMAFCLAGAAGIMILITELFWPAFPVVQRAQLPANRAIAPSKTQELIPARESEQGVKIISDEELLALFPGRPVALIGPPGRQRLIFLDEPDSSNPL